MSEKEYLEKTNSVRLVGELEGEFEYYYTLSTKGVYEEYYLNYIKVKKGNEHIPIVMEKSKIDFNKQYKDEKVEIVGKLKETNFQKKAFMYVYVKKMEQTIKDSINHVKLECKIHKKIITRVHQDGRLRLDFKVLYNARMVFSCVAWNRNARYIKKKVKENDILIEGKIKTRYYSKNGNLIEVNELEVTDIHEK